MRACAHMFVRTNVCAQTCAHKRMCTQYPNRKLRMAHKTPFQFEYPTGPHRSPQEPTGTPAR